MGIGINRRKELIFSYGMMAPTILLFLLVALFPLAYSLELSLHSYNLLKPSAGREAIGLANYARIFSSPSFWHAFRVSILYTIGTVSIQFLLGLGLALVLNREFPGRNLARTLVLVPLLITPVIVGLMWRWMLNSEVGLINFLISSIGLHPPVWLGDPSVALTTVILVDVWHLTPFTVLVLLAGLQGLDPELFEATRIDGASAWQTFWGVTMPLLIQTATTVLLFSTMYSFWSFDKIFALTQGGPGRATEVLGYLVYRTSFKEFHMGYGAALSWVMLLLVVGVAGLYMKLLKEPD